MNSFIERVLAAKGASEVTPEMIKAIDDWFTGKFMKGGGFGLKPSIIAEIRKFTPLSTPPKARKLYRAHLTPIKEELKGTRMVRRVYLQKVGKILALEKSANTLKSWTLDEKTAAGFYHANFSDLPRGRGKVGYILEAPFAESEYVTDIYSVLTLVKKPYPNLFKALSFYKDTKEVLMFMKPQPVKIVRVMFHDKD